MLKISVPALVAGAARWRHGLSADAAEPSSPVMLSFGGVGYFGVSGRGRGLETIEVPGAP